MLASASTKLSRPGRSEHLIAQVGQVPTSPDPFGVLWARNACGVRPAGLLLVVDVDLRFHVAPLPMHWKHPNPGLGQEPVFGLFTSGLCRETGPGPCPGEGGLLIGGRGYLAGSRGIRASRRRRMAPRC